MRSGRTDDREGHAHCVTSSHDRRRRTRDHDRVQRIVLGALNSPLPLQEGRRIACVVRPDHGHAIVGSPAHDPIAHVMKPWKPRSSVPIERRLREASSA